MGITVIHCLASYDFKCFNESIFYKILHEFLMYIRKRQTQMTYYFFSFLPNMHMHNKLLS